MRERLSSICHVTLLVFCTVNQAIAQSSITSEGMIESKSGGYKFPDGSVQVSAAEQGPVGPPGPPGVGVLSNLYLEVDVLSSQPPQIHTLIESVIDLGATCKTVGDNVQNFLILNNVSNEDLHVSISTQDVVSNPTGYITVWQGPLHITPNSNVGLPTDDWETLFSLSKYQVKFWGGSVFGEFFLSSTDSLVVPNVYRCEHRVYGFAIFLN